MGVVGVGGGVMFLVILVHIAVSVLTHGMDKKTILLVRTKCFLMIVFSSIFLLLMLCWVLLAVLLWGNDT